MSTYLSIEAYTADVIKAVRAYESDEAVRAGLCANLDGRKTDTAHRQCWACRHPKRREGAGMSAPSRLGVAS